ncbi:hypothetical protein ABRP87_10475 [Corynebacterium sp. KPL2830]|uniref:hypothetical protein n=1 Tax=Corynebacterium sp. KPL2830 TaxID=3158315 RepID=UPI0032ECED15
MNSYTRIVLSAVLGLLLVTALAHFEIISWESGGVAGFTAIAVATLISIIRYKKEPKDD